MSKELLSRRQLFRAAGVGAVGIVAADLIGCSGDERVPVVVTRQVATPTLETPELKTYSGPIESLEGKPLIEEAKFASIVDALRNCSFPLFQMAAGQLEALYYENANPTEFPAYINEDTTPLPVTYDRLTDSLATGRFIYKPEAPDNTFILKTASLASKYTEIESITLGINLGVRPQGENESPLSKGMFLTKELFTHMLSIKMGEEFYQIMNGLGMTEVDDSEGNPITDPAKLKIVGVNLFWNEIKNQNTDIWKADDIFPAMIVGTGLETLIGRGELPAESPLFGNFAKVIGTLKNNKEALNEVKGIIDKWVINSTFLPPDTTTSRVLSVPLQLAITQIANQIYGN